MIRATVNQGEAIPSDKFGRPLGTFATPEEWLSVRRFDTGATRDTDAGKVDYEGFLSPYAIRAFGDYMDRHRHQADGNVRDSDNWQRGIPLDAYMKSMWRHFFDVWSEHRGISTPAGLKENLCALKFNVDGMLHELVKAEADHTPGAGYTMPLADRDGD